MKDPGEVGNYQTENQQPVQGQVIGESNTVIQHFYPPELHAAPTNPQRPIVVTSKVLDVDYVVTAGQDGRRVLVPASGHTIRLTVEAADSRTTIIQNLYPVVLSRSEATGRLSPHWGIVTPRPFEVLLDEVPPVSSQSIQRGRIFLSR